VTNDGEFANRVSHPRYGIPKEYLVKVQGKLDTRALQATLQGVWDAGELLKPSSVSVISEARKNQWLRVVMREGKYHEIRRLFGHQGYFVLKSNVCGLALSCLGRFSLDKPALFLSKRFVDF